MDLEGQMENEQHTHDSFPPLATFSISLPGSRWLRFAQGSMVSKWYMWLPLQLLGQPALCVTIFPTLSFQSQQIKLSLSSCDIFQLPIQTCRCPHPDLLHFSRLCFSPASPPMCCPSHHDSQNIILLFSPSLFWLSFLLLFPPS